MYREVLDFLKMNDVEYKNGVSLATISPVRIGGEADIVAYPACEMQFFRLVQFLINENIKHKIVGRMSNVLFSDKKYRGVIIRSDRMSSFRIYGNILTVECGVALPYISLVLCSAGLHGFEGLSGIPGSIAGALIGNAGAFGYEISDSLIDVRCFDTRRERIIVFSKNELDFSYRSSFFKRYNFPILSARFALEERECAEIKAEMEKYREIRRKTQPTDQPSLGSTFKRPSDTVYAARLIDECGLKGFGIGGAQVSAKHAGFIVNRGGATALDYIELSDYVKERVLERFGVSLEREIEII